MLSHWVKLKNPTTLWQSSEFFRHYCNDITNWNIWHKTKNGTNNCNAMTPGWLKVTNDCHIMLYHPQLHPLKFTFISSEFIMTDESPLHNTQFSSFQLAIYNYTIFFSNQLSLRNLHSVPLYHLIYDPTLHYFMLIRRQYKNHKFWQPSAE